MFGYFDDPESEVSRLTRERDGRGLLPELGYKPVNQYLPPRRVVATSLNDSLNAKANSASKMGEILAWINKFIVKNDIIRMGIYLKCWRKSHERNNVDGPRGKKR